jgi:hypothetical protein
MYGALKDFDPVVKEIAAAGLKPPYNWDQYASYFMVAGESLVISAKEAEKDGRKEKAAELYMYVGAVTDHLSIYPFALCIFFLLTYDPSYLSLILPSCR